MEVEHEALPLDDSAETPVNCPEGSAEEAAPPGTPTEVSPPHSKESPAQGDTSAPGPDVEMEELGQRLEAVTRVCTATSGGDAALAAPGLPDTEAMLLTTEGEAEDVVDIRVSEEEEKALLGEERGDA